MNKYKRNLIEGEPKGRVIFMAGVVTFGLFVALQLLGIEGGSVDGAFVSGRIVVSDNPIFKFIRQIKDNIFIYGFAFATLYYLLNGGFFRRRSN